MLRESELYCVRKEAKNSDSNPSYEVRVRFTRSEDEVLLSGLQELEEAQYIERAVEHVLGLQPYAVRGEAS